MEASVSFMLYITPRVYFSRLFLFCCDWMEREILAGFKTNHIDLSMFESNIEIFYGDLESRMFYQTSAAFVGGNHVEHL